METITNNSAIFYHLNGDVDELETFEETQLVGGMVWHNGKRFAYCGTELYSSKYQHPSGNWGAMFVTGKRVFQEYPVMETVE